MICPHSPTIRKKKREIAFLSLNFFLSAMKITRNIDFIFNIYLFTTAMLFGANTSAFASATAVWTCVNAAVFCYPITFTHALMYNTFTAIRAIIWTNNQNKPLNRIHQFFIMNFTNLMITHQLLTKNSAWKPFST